MTPLRPGEDPEQTELTVEQWDSLGYALYWVAFFIALFSNGGFLFFLIVFGCFWWLFKRMTDA